MEKQYHLQIDENDIGKYVILCGDPGRCKKIAQRLDDGKLVASNREFTTYTGKLLGENVSVTSTGIGGPSAAIAMEELVKCNAHTFIRVGTCGGINEKVKSGNCIIATGAIRNEGTSKEYAPLEYPAVSDFQVTCSLVNAALKNKITYHCGVVQCKDSFYGQHSPERMPVSYELKNKWEAWKKLGVLGSEMESAALFTVASALDVRCGTVLHTIWNQERNAHGKVEKDQFDTENAIIISVDAIKELIEEDKNVR